MSPKHVPTLAFTMILGGDAFKGSGEGVAWLALCLESIRVTRPDQLIIVDTGVNDRALALIEAESEKRMGEGLPAIELYPFEWCDDFSAARNEGLRYVHSDYMAWIDGDDVLKGGEYLRTMLGHLAKEPDALGTWNKYVYSFDGYGNPNTVHTRERVVHMSAGWHWTHRIHEVLTPEKPGYWVEDHKVSWSHLRPFEPQQARNLRLLYMEYHDNPSPRTVNGIANQYFAGGEWEKAAEWYERFFADTRANLGERWQSICFASRSYRFMEQHENALTLAKMAVEMVPIWSDGYLQLAEAYFCLGEWSKSVYWALHSRQQKEKPFPYLLHNPVEYGAQAASVLYRNYAMLGEYDNAMAEAQTVEKWMPGDENLLQHIGILKDLAAQNRIKEGFLRVAPELSDKAKLDLWGRLNGAGRFAEVRDIAIPALLRRTRRGTQPEITFYCGKTLDEWTGRTPQEIGIGGSETAVVAISRRLAQRGYKIWVYNSCGDNEGMEEGVGYIDWQRWRMQNKTDIFVAWRTPLPDMSKVTAQAKWLWMHDLNKGAGINLESAGFMSKVFGVSDFHADYLRRFYPFLADKMGVLPNGIEVDYTPQDVKREDFKVVYTSSPDRGLIHLLSMWPHIVKAEPTASLHVYYGWDNMDKMIRMGYKDRERQKSIIENMMSQSKNVHWHGKVSQKELARELASAKVWAYPTAFVETFCIAALEAMASGCMVVTSKLGNLPSVVGDAGLLIPDHPQTKAYQNEFTGCLLASLMDLSTQLQFAGRGTEQVRQFTWEKAIDRWEEEITLALEPQKVMVA